MAKLALIFISIFLLAQLAICEEEVEQNVETTTKNGFDHLKDQVGKIFTEENMNRTVEGFKDFTDKVKALGEKAVGETKKFFKIGDTTEAP